MTSRPEIELLGVNRETLTNQEVIATVEPIDATGKHPALLKFFYGKDQVAQAAFQIVVP